MYSCAVAASSSFFGAASAASSTASAAASAPGGGGGGRDGLFGGGGDVGLGAGVQCEQRGEGRNQGTGERFHVFGVVVWFRRAVSGRGKRAEFYSRLPCAVNRKVARV